ncbi:glycoside hydrolase family 68 protein [Saliphagus infecundisoli]|uniref:Glycoside hydrolase family 68 protein n=1 Tax=Saliphagus infecundisoli TaxID=1849069 RepID=A0ABD5QCV3_9EURY|nr:glycoside hydrolase family 68 protein [Saliphagus infecundisoli]
MGHDEDGSRREGPPWSRWTEGQAAGIGRTADTVVPKIEPPEPDPADGLHVWDTWLLRTRTGEVATVGDYRVLFSLTAPADLLPGTRHDVAEIRYFYSRDGREWTDGGPVFADALGQRQWAGSALVDDGDLYVYYTAAGEADAPELSYTQRPAVGHGGRFSASEDGLALESTWSHEVLFKPDGEHYETADQSEGMIYTFRDPWFFEDPETGRTCLLFEANTPVREDDRCDGDPARREFNGCVGLAVSPSGDPTEWELRPPILDAVCVNQELERPHVVHRDGRYYLFVSSHMHTFAPGLEGYDGLYGFVADSLDGEYRPLNGSGLVLANPATAPFQAYSWMAYPHREEILVVGFFNYFDFAGDSLDAISELSLPEQRRRFGGTLAPTVRLGIERDRTRILGTLAHWEVPTPAEPLPEPATRPPLDLDALADGDEPAGPQGYPFGGYAGRDTVEE